MAWAEGADRPLHALQRLPGHAVEAGLGGGVADVPDPTELAEHRGHVDDPPRHPARYHAPGGRLAECVRRDDVVLQHPGQVDGVELVTAASTAGPSPRSRATTSPRTAG